MWPFEKVKFDTIEYIIIIYFTIFYLDLMIMHLRGPVRIMNENQWFRKITQKSKKE